MAKITDFPPIVSSGGFSPYMATTSSICPRSLHRATSDWPPAVHSPVSSLVNGMSPIPFLPLVVVYSGSSPVSSPPSEFVPPPVFLSRHMNSYGLKKIFQSPIMFSLNPVSGKLFLHKMHVNNMI